MVTKKNNRHKTPPQTHIEIIMQRTKGIGILHKVEHGTIRVENEGLLVTTGDLIARTFTQRETSFHNR